MSKTIKQWQEEVHQLAIEKGWWVASQTRSPLELHMLMVSELAEATEEARKGMPAVYKLKEMGDKQHLILQSHDSWSLYATLKPEGELVELADAVIRIMDYCESKGWDLEQAIALKHEYNQTRSHRHGGKKY